MRKIFIVVALLLSTQVFADTNASKKAYDLVCDHKGKNCQEPTEFDKMIIDDGRKAKERRKKYNGYDKTDNSWFKPKLKDTNKTK